ncbi:MAG TPA: amino acid adenylation domain-containing protein [Ktedonobacterales bacterium]|nr:amino acid adenylation domain-containing protein [Ktedonobacterales bacterium]
MSDLDQRIASLSPEKREILLQRLNQQTRADNASKAIPRRSAATQPIPLSFAQESLWLIHQLAPESTAYNLVHALRLLGTLNLTILEQSLQEIVNRHETLRTTFRVVEGQPRQIIAPTLKIPLSVVDLATFPEPERAMQARQRMETEIARPFDLAQGPLLRVTLLRLTEQESILLLLLHHTVSDEWSQNVFVRELTTLYGAIAANEPSPLAELPIQYADYVLWQRERLKGEEHLGSLLDYWKKQLSGAPAVLELPTDHPRPTVQTFRGAQVPFQVPSAITDRLRLLSQQEQTSLFMALLASFQALLARYTSRDDILIGSPIANRARPETVGMIGYLVNMLVLRADFSGQPSFRQLLRQVRATALEAYAHQELPFEKLVEALQPERSLSYNPIFQVLFQLENDAPASFETAGLTWQVLETTNYTSQFDLQLSIHERSDQLSGYFKYSADLFEPATIERLGAHWLTLLEGIVADPDQPITTLPLLTQTERQQLLVERNATELPALLGQCFPQLFEAQAERTPEATAVIDEEENRLTYKQLNERANQLAHYLRQLEVGPEVLVGLCVDRSVEMLVGLLGILKAGGAYVPLDPTYPSERLAFMLEDSHATVLVTQEPLRAQLPTGSLNVVSLDGDQAHLAEQPRENLPPSAQPDNLAYVIYTSGSTGKPKGVQVLQRALVNFLLSMQQQPGLAADDRLLAVTTLSFDIAGLELLLPLSVGAQVIVVSRDTAANGAALALALERSQATVMQATPVTWRLLLETGWQGSLSLKALCGGEALPLDLARQLLARCGSLWNLYGPTETTIWSTVRQVTREDSLVSIGRPIANTQVYVLDGQLQPAPIGVPGELYIGGEGLARGYLHRPELTSERFIPHPFSQTPGARLYRTGDLARFLPTGELEHLGRLDHQVKLRGFRIELGEIEAVLAQHPAVRQAVVVARESGGDKRLVAYLLAQEGQQVTMQVLRPFLREHLPDYMIPSACMVLDTFPQTPNGKIDRKALPAPEASERGEGEGYVPPDLIEHYELIGIWEDMLNVRPIGIRDSFFELGGHSLLAAQMINRIELVFSKKIPLATFYADPTIERLAHLLRQQEMIPDMPVVPVQTGGSKRPFFFLHGDLVGGAWYCFPLARLLGPEQPFYSIQPYKFDGRQVPPKFEEQAAAHIQSLRAIQPEGPYLLGGFCFGGLLAYEMARQLQAQGQQVDFLLLINTTSPAARSLRLLRSTVNQLSKLLRLGGRKAFYGFLWTRHLYQYLRFSGYRQATNKTTQKSGTRSSALPNRRTIFPSLEFLGQGWGAVNSWVLSAYRPGTYPGKITFFWVQEELADAKKWQQVTAAAKATDLQLIPGTHLGCLQQHLPTLAEQLSQRLKQVQAVEQSEPV